MLYCPNLFWNVLQVWMTGKDVYLQMTWSWPDKTWNILCSYCLQWNTSQSKFRNHYFLFLFAFSILSQLFLIWGCMWSQKKKTSAFETLSHWPQTILIVEPLPRLKVLSKKIYSIISIAHSTLISKDGGKFHFSWHYVFLRANTDWKSHTYQRRALSRAWAKAWCCEMLHPPSGWQWRPQHSWLLHRAALPTWRADRSGNTGNCGNRHTGQKTHSGDHASVHTRCSHSNVSIVEECVSHSSNSTCHKRGKYQIIMVYWHFLNSWIAQKLKQRFKSPK